MYTLTRRTPLYILRNVALSCARNVRTGEGLGFELRIPSIRSLHATPAGLWISRRRRSARARERAYTHRLVCSFGRTNGISSSYVFDTNTFGIAGIYGSSRKAVGKRSWSRAIYDYACRSRDVSRFWTKRVHTRVYTVTYGRVGTWVGAVGSPRNVRNWQNLTV